MFLFLLVAVFGTGPLLLVTAVGVCLLMPRAFCMLGCFSFFWWLCLVVAFWRSGASARLGCSSSSLGPLGGCVGVCLVAFVFSPSGASASSSSWWPWAAVAICPMALGGFCCLWLVLRFALRVFFFFFLGLLLLLFLFPFLPLLGFLLCLSVFSGLLPASLAWCLAFPCAWLGRPHLTSSCSCSCSSSSSCCCCCSSSSSSCLFLFVLFVLVCSCFFLFVLVCSCSCFVLNCVG